MSELARLTERNSPTCQDRLKQMNTISISRLASVIWIVATLLIAGMLWSQTVKIAPQFTDGVVETVKVHFQLCGVSQISLETDALHGQSSRWWLQFVITLGFVLLSLACGSAIWLACSRNIMLWLDSAARVSLLGGFFIYGAAVISASKHLLPSTVQVDFFAGLFGVVSTYTLVVIHLAAWRDMAEGRPGAAALISRIGIEAIAWITGAVGLLAVVVALGGKFLLLFVR
jgi:hypothetical protein